MDKMIDTKEFRIEPPILSCAAVNGRGDDGVRIYIQLVLTWRYYISVDHAEDFEKLCCQLQKRVLEDLDIQFSRGRAITLKD